MSNQIEIPILLTNTEATIPQNAKPGDAGVDLCSSEVATIFPGERALIGTGVAIAIPEGYAGFVQPRSGLAIKNGIGVLNTPGLIDSGYRGEIKVILLNTDKSNAFNINVGDRIAQLVIQRVENVNFLQIETLDETERGDGGFGHTGIASQ